LDALAVATPFSKAGPFTPQQLASAQVVVSHDDHHGFADLPVPAFSTVLNKMTPAQLASAQVAPIQILFQAQPAPRLDPHRVLGGGA
jgi:hypothetical protein